MTGSNDDYQKGFNDAIKLAIDAIKTRRDYYVYMRQGYVGGQCLGPYANMSLMKYSLLLDECDAVMIELAVLSKRKQRTSDDNG